MEKEIEAILRVKVKVTLDDPEATEDTVRFLIEQDLRDNGWEADVEVETEDDQEDEEDELVDRDWLDARYFRPKKDGHYVVIANAHETNATYRDGKWSKPGVEAFKGECQRIEKRGRRK